MKILIVYYSRTGLTKRLGEKLAAALGADQEEIKNGADRGGVIGYLKCGREAMQKALPPIGPSHFDPAVYDLVVVGTPVWAATMASPVRSYLNAQAGRIKRAAFFATQGGSGANRAFDDMAELCALAPVARLTVLSREIIKGGYDEKMQGFIKEING